MCMVKNMHTHVRVLVFPEGWRDTIALHNLRYALGPFFGTSLAFKPSTDDETKITSSHR